MYLVKEQVKIYSGTRIILRTGYGSYLQTFLELFEEAKKDFPGLKSEEVKIIHYGGQRYRGTWGIEFNVDFPSCIPVQYTPRPAVEFQL